MPEIQKNRKKRDSEENGVHKLWKPSVIYGAWLRSLWRDNRKPPVFLSFWKPSPLNREITMNSYLQPGAFLVVYGQYLPDLRAVAKHLGAPRACEFTDRELDAGPLLRREYWGGRPGPIVALVHVGNPQGLDPALLRFADAAVRAERDEARRAIQYRCTYRQAPSRALEPIRVLPIDVAAEVPTEADPLGDMWSAGIPPLDSATGLTLSYDL